MKGGRERERDGREKKAHFRKCPDWIERAAGRALMVSMLFSNERQTKLWRHQITEVAVMAVFPGFLYFCSSTCGFFPPQRAAKTPKCLSLVQKAFRLLDEWWRPQVKMVLNWIIPFEGGRGGEDEK